MAKQYGPPHHYDPLLLQPSDDVEPRRRSDAKRPPIRGPPIPRGAYSIRQFCLAHGISRDLYFRMQREGWGPQVMRLGGRVLISIEAAERWRRAREAATAVGED